MNNRKQPFFSALSHKMWDPLVHLMTLGNTRAKDLEGRMARIEAEADIRDVHLAYTYSYDEGDVPGAIKCFHKDCVLVNPRGIYEGIAAIEENYRYLVNRRRFSFHNTTNIAVRVSDDLKEAGMVAFLSAVAVQHSGLLTGLNGTYVDRLIKTDEGWKIIERRITSNVRYHLMPSPQIGSHVLPPPTGTSPGSSQEWLGEAAIV